LKLLLQSRMYPAEPKLSSGDVDHKYIVRILALSI
jgi:hypothetical protein